MANTYKSTQFDPDTPLPKGYQGRSPYDEYIFSERTPVPYYAMRDQHLDPHKNRNFSALNLSPVQKRNIIDQSYIRNNLPVPNRGYSALGSRMNAMNLPMPSGSGQKKVVNNTPPNLKNNLLNYISSPKGKGMAQGLLEASGYSDMPVSFGQALSQGIKRGNEAQAQADATAFKNKQFEYQKNRDVISDIFTQQGLSLEQQKLLQPKMSDFARMLIDMGIDPNSEEGRELLMQKLTSAKNEIKIINPEETNEKIRLEEFRIDGDFLKEEKKFFNSAREINSKLLQMKGLIEKGLKTDKFAPWKETFMAVLNSADFLTDDEKSELADMENFSAMAAYMAPRMRAIGSGATSDFEVGMFIKAAPSLEKTEEGNLKIIAGMQQLNDFNMKKYKAMDRWFRENKSLGINLQKGSKGEGLTFEEYWTQETGDTIFQQYRTAEDFEKLKSEGKVKANQYVIYIDEDNIEHLVWMKPDMFKEDN